MSVSELQKTLIEQTKDFSAETLVEVVDFVQFLKVKKTTDVIPSELHQLSRDEDRHLNEEFAGYKTLYPVQ